MGILSSLRQLLSNDKKPNIKPEPAPIVKSEPVQIPQQKTVEPEENPLAKRIKYIKSKEAEFNQTLESLPKFDICINSSFNPPEAEDFELKISNITAKTNIDRIKDFVVLDLETTGLRKSSGIVEVSAIKFKDFAPVEIFSTLVKPSRKIPPEASAVNGITDDMVANAPKVSEISESLFQFVGSNNIIGHNLEFDLGVLEHKGICFGKRKYYDTFKVG